MVAVYLENHETHKYTMWARYMVSSVKTCGAYSYQRVLRVY
jgi:hypothetical protein